MAIPRYFFAALLVFSLLSAGLAATCGNNKAEGSEECDGSDLRGYYCTTVGDYEGPTDYYNQGGGTLACKSNCKFNTANCYYCICGDGSVRCAEECDNGQMNSDTAPNACRTDCVLPHCRDDVVDNGEACDDGPQNSDEIPNACRYYCVLPSCGDGVVDHQYGEECEPSLNPDCSSQCKLCLTPTDNLHISGAKKLCQGSYTFDDKGEEGILILEQGSILDCNGAYLLGPGAIDIPQTSASASAAQQRLNEEKDEQSSANPISSLFNNLFKFFGAGKSDPNSVSLRSGTGIVAKANTILINCHVFDFRIGIRATPSTAIINSEACQNNNDIKSDSPSYFGVRNTCDEASNWNDIGFLDCSRKCDASSGTAASGENQPCPACEDADCSQCQECEQCDTPEPCECGGQQVASIPEPIAPIDRPPELDVVPETEPEPEPETEPSVQPNLVSPALNPVLPIVTAPTFKTYEECSAYYTNLKKSSDEIAKLCAAYPKQPVQVISTTLPTLNKTISPITKKTR